MSQALSDAVLVVNAGSHSVKLALIGPAGETLLQQDVDAKPDGDEAADALSAFVGNVGRPSGVGHRVVHGGRHLSAHSLIDGSALRVLEDAADIAPLHVPPALAAIRMTRELLPDVPQVACVDTVFHRDMPEVAATYPVPLRWRQEFGVRRYGFHGLSYTWALGRAAELLHRPGSELQVVMTHLGGGSSVCAVTGGRSVWSSMGFTPLEGLPMSARSGSVDPGMLLWLQTSKGLSAQDVSDGLEHHSGLLGLSAGRSGDTRELVAAAQDGDGPSRLALDVFTFRVRQEIAAAAASLSRLDAVVFTGEIGADQPEIRESVAAGLSVLGLSGGLDPGQERDRVLSAAGAEVPVLLVHPREDLQIAIETRAVLAGNVKEHR